MFEGLPEKLKSYDLPADVRLLLLLRKAMDRGLVKTLGDIYNVLKGIVVKDPKMMGPFTRAYYDYFLNIDIQNGDRLSDAIRRSETFKKWRDDNLDRFGDNIDTEDLINHFLDDVHLTTYDIKEIISGRDIWDNDDPSQIDSPDGDGPLGAQRKHLDQMADYSDLTLEELLERMKEVMDQQNSKHSGGSHWVGTGGISPYGHGGAAKDGLRVGGTGGGKMARKVLNDRKFFPVDMDSIINDNNVDAALASLKGIIEESAHDELDIPETIDKGLKRGGLFMPEMKSITDEKLQVLLLIDNGGYSMDPFIRIVQTLFRKMKTRFAHDLETYYFHNTIYDYIYTDAHRSKYIPIKKILQKDPNYRVFIIGDASMAPYELNATSRNTYKELVAKFKRTVWLNPEPQRYWHHTFTIQVIKELIDMYPLTPRGIEKAVQEMNRKQA
ncbi:MAG: hypothetical protein P1U56_03270 [Saprospiraceae bacterium]|nr:hypothetical protein [Saprospiraceae bacterium]